MAPLATNVENDGRFIKDAEVVTIHTIWGHTGGEEATRSPAAFLLIAQHQGVL